MMTECSSPPEIPEFELLRFMGGEGQEIAGHLERCAHCTGRLENLRAALNGLSRKVYRAKCPTSMELTAYQLGESNAEEAALIRDHLALCAACREELAGFRQFLESTGIEPTPGTGFLERAGVWVASLFAGGPDRVSPVGVGLRGEADGVRIYEAGDLQVTLTVLEETAGRSRIAGLLSGTPPDGWTAELWHIAERVSVVEIDPGGEFSFAAVPPGEYTLILDGAQGEIHIQELKV
jgi:hypothetical protein